MLILTKHTPETTLRAAHFRFVFCYFVFCILQLVSLMKPLCLKTRFRQQVLCDNWNGKQFNKNADFPNIEQWTVAKDTGHPCSLPLPLHLEVTLYLKGVLHVTLMFLEQRLCLFLPEYFDI